MSVTDVITIPAVDASEGDVELILQRIDVEPSVTPYSRKLTLTIGDDVFTFETADLFEAVRLLQGS